MHQHLYTFSTHTAAHLVILSDQQQALNMPAIIGKPAPAFKGQAVVDGEIKEISLDDFKGERAVA